MEEFITDPDDWPQVIKLGNQFSKRPSPLYYHLIYMGAKYTSVLMTTPFENALVLKQMQFKGKSEEQEQIVDVDGYLVPADELNQFQIPNLATTWTIFGSIIYSKDEGFASLWKELGVSIVEALVMLPIETIRRRLQCQVIRKAPKTEKDDREFIGCVPLSKIPYTGIMDAFYRISSEEGGIRELYRGLRVRVVGSIMVALLQALTRLIEE
ncbi:hypothetical protein HDV04_003151 [Boothiomyces sp. JEL0838]|nr:hypothetical protein HDV04_003151 [Boothiomyces sp. JEL0838]